jgi:hypothetical protein
VSLRAFPFRPEQQRGSSGDFAEKVGLEPTRDILMPPSVFKTAAARPTLGLLLHCVRWVHGIITPVRAMTPTDRWGEPPLQLEIPGAPSRSAHTVVPRDTGDLNPAIRFGRPAPRHLGLCPVMEAPAPSGTSAYVHWCALPSRTAPLPRDPDRIRTGDLHRDRVASTPLLYRTICASLGVRTQDPPGKSRLLYQLS